MGEKPENTEVIISDIILQEQGSGKVSWNADSDCNIWKTSTDNNTFYDAPSWAQIADPTVSVNGNSYTIDLSSATTDQWQAQVHFHTNMTSNSATTYDFHCIINSTQDVSGITVKLTKEGDDNTFYFAERVKVEAYSDYVFEMTGMPGIDMDDINLVFDFGSNPDNTEVTISKVIFKESNCNN